MSDPAEYQSWLETGFAWLADNWAEQGWADVRAGFLAALGLAAAEDDPVVHALVTEIDQLAPELQRDAVLGHPAQGELVQRALAAAGSGAEPVAGPAGAVPEAPAEATAPSAAVEPVYVEGTGWMSWDAGAGTWVPMAGAPAAQDGTAPDVAAPDSAGAPAAESPVPAAADAAEPGAPAEQAAERAAPAEPAAEPAAVAAQVTEQVVLPALTEAVAAMPELAQFSTEELNQMVSEVLAERIAAAQG